MHNFRETLSSVSLLSLPARGPQYTWDNNCKHPEKVLERHDRYCANQVWKTTFPDAFSKNLDFYNSDHRLILINVSPSNSSIWFNHQKSFMFNHNWIMEGDYHQTLSHSWKAKKPNESIHIALHDCSIKIKNWAKEWVGSLSNKIKDTRNRLNFLNERASPSDHLEEIGILEASLEKLLLKEEIY